MKDVNNNFSVEELTKDLNTINNKVIQIIEDLKEEEYKKELLTIGISHPIAKNKIEALSWNVQHNMWHSGQMATLIKLNGSPLDFNLREKSSLFEVLSL